VRYYFSKITINSNEISSLKIRITQIHIRMIKISYWKIVILIKMIVMGIEIISLKIWIVQSYIRMVIIKFWKIVILIKNDHYENRNLLVENSKSKVSYSNYNYLTFNSNDFNKSDHYENLNHHIEKSNIKFYIRMIAIRFWNKIILIKMVIKRIKIS
jgi:hypothetical protein